MQAGVCFKICFLLTYLLVSIGIGLFADRNAHSTKDDAIAGRHKSGRQIASWKHSCQLHE